jgi:hypothetical protein
VLEKKGFEQGKEYNIVLGDGEQLEGVAKTVTPTYVEFELKDGRVLSIQEVGKRSLIILKGEAISEDVVE